MTPSVNRSTYVVILVRCVGTQMVCMMGYMMYERPVQSVIHLKGAQSPSD